MGVSANWLAGSVAAIGAVGTLSSVDLRRHHPDLMEATRDAPVGPEAKARINAANMAALRREIAAARTHAGGRGLLAVDVMRALGVYVPSVQTALKAGIDGAPVGRLDRLCFFWAGAAVWWAAHFLRSVTRLSNRNLGHQGSSRNRPEQSSM